MEGPESAGDPEPESAGGGEEEPAGESEAEPAGASEAEPAGASEEEPQAESAVASGEEVQTHLTAEAGAALATGNASYQTLSGAVKGDRSVGRNKISGSFGLLNGRSKVDGNANGRIDEDERAAESVETARNLTGGVRYDFLLNDVSTLYVLASMMHDPFAGYLLRTNEQLGYGRKIVASEATNLGVSIGLDAAQEVYVEGVDPSRAFPLSVTAGVALTAQFKEMMGFSFTLDAYQNLLDREDLRILTETTLTSQLSGRVSLKLTHVLVYDNQPVTGFYPVDQFLTAGVVASFL